MPTETVYHDNYVLPFAVKSVNMTNRAQTDYCTITIMWIADCTVYGCSTQITSGYYQGSGNFSSQTVDLNGSHAKGSIQELVITKPENSDSWIQYSVDMSACRFSLG